MAGAWSVHIELLGRFAVSVGTVRVPDGAWRLRKAKTLVQLLALTPGHRLPWEQPGETLWPDRDTGAVRNNLNQVLRAARGALTAAGLDARQALRVRDGVVAFGEDVDVSVDVEAFARAVEAARASDSLAAYERAERLYLGDLLPDERYEDWSTERRTALREQHAAVLLALARKHRARGDPGAAVAALRRLLVAQALHEPARRELMSLLAATGRLQEALATYEALREALRRDLEADPDSATRRLYRDLLTGSAAFSLGEEASPGDGSATEGPLTGSTGNLPLPMSSFVGRERELVQIERLLARSRLLTLTGVGGSGKTRLALEVARRRLGVHRDGVWVVDLAPVSEAGGVPEAIAGHLRLELPECSPAVPAVVRQLSDRQLLLVLDNCEHLLEACAEVALALLRSCTGLRLLATSRAALRVEGEVAWHVPPLALPDLRRDAEPAVLKRHAAVRLFCERAAAAAPGFGLSARNAAAVARLCVRLDGLPLALELAAAGVPMLSPTQILERLDEAVDVRGSRTTLTRQRTLRGTLNWSHDLLDDDARRVFRRLAVFAGSFGLDAAEHVCADASHSGAVLARLGGLVDQSLVVTLPHGDVARYRLLETVRQYASERLDAAGERPTIERRHRAWYRRWAEEHDPERSAAAGEVALQPFEVEHDNLRAALRSALRDEPGTALHLATSLWRFWLARGHFAEGRRWLEAALQVNPEASALRARGLLAVAVLDMRSAVRRTRLPRLADEVVDIHRRLDDPVALAQALHLSAVVLWPGHRPTRTHARLDEAWSAAIAAGAPHVLAATAHTRAVVELSRGEAEAAGAHLAAAGQILAGIGSSEGGFFPAICPGFTVERDDTLQLRPVFIDTLVMGHRLDAGPARALLDYSLAWAAADLGDLPGAVGHARVSAAGFAAEGWHYGVALADHLLGNLLRRDGAYDEAGAALERSLQLRARLGDRRATGVSLGGLGLLAGAQGDEAGAQRLLGRALELFDRIDDGFGRAAMLLNLGVVAVRRGDHDEADRLFAQVQRLGDAPGLRRPSGWVTLVQAELAVHRGDGRGAHAHLASARVRLADLEERRGLAHCDLFERQLALR